MALDRWWPSYTTSVYWQVTTLQAFIENNSHIQVFMFVELEGSDFETKHCDWRLAGPPTEGITITTGWRE